MEPYFAELDLDFSKFEKNQQKLLQSAVSTSLSVEKNWQNLGVKSDNIFNAMRASIQNSFNMIKSHAGTTAAEMIRAQEALAAKLKKIDEEQFGKRTTMLEGFKKNWIAMTAVMAGVGISTSAAIEMIKLGAAAKQTEDAFTQLAARAGESSAAIIDAMKRATAGTVDDTDLMQKAIKGMALGLTGEDMVKVAEMARQTARVTGQSVGETFSALADAISTNMPRALKQMGLITKEQMTIVQEAMSKGVENVNLLEIAYANYRDQAAKLGPLHDNEAEKLQQLNAEWNQLKETIGQTMIGVILGLAHPIDTITRSLKTQSDQIEENIDDMSRLAAAYGRMQEKPTEGPKLGEYWWQGGGEAAGASTELKWNEADIYRRRILSNADVITRQLKEQIAAIEAQKKATSGIDAAEKERIRQLERQFQLVEKIGAAQIESAGDYEAIEAKAYVEWERMEQKKIERGYADAEKMAEKQVREQEKALAKQQEQWEHFWERVQDVTSDTLYDIFSGNINSWGDMLTTMKNMFLRWIADIAAQKIRVAVENQFTSSLTGGSGGLGSTGISGIGSIFSEEGISSFLASFGSSTPAVGESSLSGLGGIGGGAAAAGGAAMIAGIAAAMVYGYISSKKDAQRGFWAGGLEQPYTGANTWTPGTGVGTASIPAEWSGNWWKEAAQAFVEGKNQIISAFNQQALAMIKALPKEWADLVEQYLKKQNWSTAGITNAVGQKYIGGLVAERKMGDEIGSMLTQIGQMYDKVIVDMLGGKYQYVMQLLQAKTLMESTLTPAWEEFVMGLKTSDLAPVQSMETFSYYFRKLQEKVQQNPTDMNAVNSLLQYTSGTYLPFAKSYTEGGTDYASIFNSIVSNQGDLYNTVFSSISDINKQFDELFIYVKELLDRPITVTVNLNGTEIAEAVAVAADSGQVPTYNWQTSGYEVVPSSPTYAGYGP